MKLFATETEGKEKRIRRLRKYSLLSLPFIVLLILVVATTCMVKDQLRGRENREFITKIQDLNSK